MIIKGSFWREGMQSGDTSVMQRAGISSRIVMLVIGDVCANLSDLGPAEKGKISDQK